MVKTARLALTDVTRVQLLVEESTNRNSWAPDARTLKMISEAAFEIDDYWRIVDVLHNSYSQRDTIVAFLWGEDHDMIIVLQMNLFPDHLFHAHWMSYYEGNP